MRADGPGSICSMGFGCEKLQVLSGHAGPWSWGKLTAGCHAAGDPGLNEGKGRLYWGPTSAVLCVQRLGAPSTKRERVAVLLS